MCHRDFFFFFVVFSFILVKVGFGILLIKTGFLCDFVEFFVKVLICVHCKFSELEWVFCVILEAFVQSVDMGSL